MLHSLGLPHRGGKPYGEIDFAVIIPGGGVLCLEVKGGRVACRNGVWETTNRHGRTERLNRSPFLQARECLFGLRDAILNRAPLGFPASVLYGYAVVLPDVTFTERSPEWEDWQVIDRDGLTRPISVSLMALVRALRRLHPSAAGPEPSPATVRTIQQLLRPDFEVMVSRATTIDNSEAQLLTLTEEQYAALDLLADNERCLFEGAAGTGKTMLAIEYARRSAASGQRTLLVCFNRLLGGWLGREAAVSGLRHLRAGSYYRLLREVIVGSSIAEDFLRAEQGGSQFELYEKTYPVSGRLAVEECADPFDVLVVDEAQDLLRVGVLEVLNVWLKGTLRAGRWVIFGDFERQALFPTTTAQELRETLRRFAPEYARGHLTLNCRNTRNIGDETALLAGFSSPPYRMGQVAGLPVDYRYYSQPDAQAAIVAELLRHLLTDGIRPSEMVVLSPYRLPNSGLARLDGGGSFRLVDLFEDPQPSSSTLAIRFATAYAFKGMESSVVILCDIAQVGDEEPQSLLYVAMSRAKSLLVVLAQNACRPAIAECVRRKLEAGWNRRP